MTILVTGATGFLGKAVTRRLRDQGREVRGTGRDEKRAPSGSPFVACDLAEDPRPLLDGVDAVVHAAALSSPWGARADFERANVRATERLLSAVRACGVRRFVHISTPSIYMGWGSRLAVREDAPLPPPINHYARTKLEAEARVSAEAQRGLETVILRPRALFGPGDTTLFPRLLRALSTGRLPVIGSGENVVDLTYIDNAVDAVLCALDAKPPALAGTYNVTNGEPVRLWDLIRTVSRALGYAEPTRTLSRRKAMAAATLLETVARVTKSRREPLLTRYGVAVLADSMTLDLTRARHALGYVPRVSIDEGLSRFLRSLTEVP